MPIDPEILLNKELEAVESSWEENRVLLYNIAVGANNDPMDKSDLQFTVGPKPKVLPLIFLHKQIGNNTRTPITICAIVPHPPVRPPSSRILWGNQ